MLKREFRLNLKSLIIWSLIVIIMFIIVFLIYPSLITENGEIEKLVKIVPKEILSIFNMDIISINSVRGWLLTEGYLFTTLIGSCFFALLGGNILLKEQSEGTIEFLYSKPIKKSQIVSSKLITGILYILIFNFLISLTTLIGLNFSNDFNLRHWFLSSIYPVFLHTFFFTFSLLISNYFKKTNKSISINIGITLGTYIIGVISLMNEKLNFLKYFSPFEYINSKSIINNELNLGFLFLFVYIIVSLIGLYSTYNKKELGL